MLLLPSVIDVSVHLRRPSRDPSLIAAREERAVACISHHQSPLKQDNSKQSIEGGSLRHSASKWNHCPVMSGRLASRVSRGVASWWPVDVIRTPPASTRGGATGGTRSSSLRRFVFKNDRTRWTRNQDKDQDQVDQDQDPVDQDQVDQDQDPVDQDQDPVDQDQDKDPVDQDQDPVDQDQDQGQDQDQVDQDQVDKDQDPVDQDPLNQDQDPVDQDPVDQDQDQDQDQDLDQDLDQDQDQDPVDQDQDQDQDSPLPSPHIIISAVLITASDLGAPGGPRCPAVRRCMRGCGPHGSAGGPLAWWLVAEGQDWPREEAHLAGA
ncbi:unnamed protein product [Arctogadus glacialis]